MTSSGQSQDDEASGLAGSLPHVRYELDVEGSLSAWRIRRMDLVEGLSEPYRLVLEVVTDDLSAIPDEFLGNSCTLHIEREGGGRRVHGVVREVELLGTTHLRMHARLELVPAFALLAMQTDTRLWQGRSVVEVISEVLENSLAPYERGFRLDLEAGDYPDREYLTQYRESDFDFISRLLEREGITYFFEHGEDGAEKLILVDRNESMPELEVLDFASLEPTSRVEICQTAADAADAETLQHFEWRRRLTATGVQSRARDWEAPSVPLIDELDVPDEFGRSRFGYEPSQFDHELAPPLAGRRLEGRRVSGRSAMARGNVTALAPGRVFELSGHMRTDLDTQWVVRRVRHRGDCPDVEIEAAENAGAPYENFFECFEAKHPFRPALVTPVPRVFGPQTALVTGPAGVEIHTDNHGRIKVLFAWDRVNAADEDTSCWMRVAQRWAGDGLGTWFLPRVGMEVIVEFIEGDPDRPFVSGCMHNGEAASHLTFPEDCTKSSIRTKSSPGGEGYNELTFEDAAGGEEIFLHAQKSLREVVKADQSTSVGSSRTLTVGGKRTETIKASQELTVHGAMATSVVPSSEGDPAEQSTTIAGCGSVHADDEYTVNAETRVFLSQAGGAGSIEFVDSNINLNADADFVSKAKANVSATAGVNYTVSAGAALEIGAANITVDANGSVAIKGGSKVTISVGAASVTIEPTKISVTAPVEIALTCGGSEVKIGPAGIECTSMGASVKIDAVGVVSSGPMVKLQGTAMVELAAPIVKLN